MTVPLAFWSKYFVWILAFFSALDGVGEAGAAAAKQESAGFAIWSAEAIMSFVIAAFVERITLFKGEP